MDRRLFLRFQYIERHALVCHTVRLRDCIAGYPLEDADICAVHSYGFWEVFHHITDLTSHWLEVCRAGLLARVWDGTHAGAERRHTAEEFHYDLQILLLGVIIPLLQTTCVVYACILERYEGNARMHRKGLCKVHRMRLRMLDLFKRFVEQKLPELSRVRKNHALGSDPPTINTCFRCCEIPEDVFDRIPGRPSGSGCTPTHTQTPPLTLVRTSVPITSANL